jgi:hypothetical protein
MFYLKVSQNCFAFHKFNLCRYTSAGKNASMGISGLYQTLRRKGRVWRAVEVFGKKPAGAGRDEAPPSPAPRLSVVGLCRLNQVDP